MDTFSYLSVLYSVILGLAVTEILQGFRKLILARKRVNFYPPLLIWMGLLLLIVAQDWWAMFGLRSVAHWSFAEYGSVLLFVVLLYLTAGLSVPDVEADGSVDMRHSYFEHSRWFFGLFATAVLASLLKGFVFDPRPQLNGDFYFHIFFFTASVIGSATKARWYHSAIAPITAVTFLVYIGLYFTRLR